MFNVFLVLFFLTYLFSPFKKDFHMQENRIIRFWLLNEPMLDWVHLKLDVEQSKLVVALQRVYSLEWNLIFSEWHLYLSVQDLIAIHNSPLLHMAKSQRSLIFSLGIQIFLSPSSEYNPWSSSTLFLKFDFKFNQFLCTLIQHGKNLHRHS